MMVFKSKNHEENLILNSDLADIKITHKKCVKNNMTKLWSTKSWSYVTDSEK